MEIYHTIYKGGDGEIEKEIQIYCRSASGHIRRRSHGDFRADKKAVLGCETSLLGLHYRKEYGGRKNE